MVFTVILPARIIPSFFQKAGKTVPFQRNEVHTPCASENNAEVQAEAVSPAVIWNVSWRYSNPPAK